VTPLAALLGTCVALVILGAYLRAVHVRDLRTADRMLAARRAALMAYHAPCGRGVTPCGACQAVARTGNLPNTRRTY
jgi:hypothetical protein